MRFDKWFILVSIICLLCGEALGEWIGAAEAFQYAPIHAHINLAGWATAALFGVMHRLYPELASARLALPQFLITVLSLPVFFFGLYKVLTAHEPLFVACGSLLFMVGTLLFAVMFIGKVLIAKGA